MLATSVISNEESLYHTSLETTPHSYFRLATGMESIVPSYDSGMSSDSSPEMVFTYLEITVQPTDKFRFRYKSESGSHGKLRGPAKNRAKTNFPTVKLHNYDSIGKIEIKVSLYTNEENPRPHILQLVGKNCSGGTCTKVLSEDNTVMFQYLEIESKKKDELLSILFKNKIDLLQEDEEYDEEELKREAVNESKTLNMNAARLCFEAFHNSKPICKKVFSNPIINLKASSDLKITRLSLAAGRCSGGEDMILLCDKINKEDIKVRFFEKNENGDVVWEYFGDFNKADVHHQVAIPFKTPALYENTEKIVYIELYRPSDCLSGEARLFTYIPDEIDAIRFSKKRKFDPMQSVVSFQEVMQASSSSSQFMSSPSDASTSRIDEDDPFLGPSTSSSYDDILDINFPDLYFLEGNQLVEPSNCVELLLKSMQNKDIHSVTDDQDMLETLDNSTSLIQMDSAISEDSSAQLSFSLKNNLGCEQKQQGSCKKSDTYKNFEDFKKSISDLLRNQKKGAFMRYIASLMSAKDEDGNLLLHLAVLQERENINLITKMLDIAPQNVNKQNKSKETCLHLATMKDSWKVLLLLMVHKGNPSIKNQAGNSCFHLAAKSNFVNSMKLLLLPNLEYGKPLPSLDELNYDGLSALHLSIMNNAKECLLLLLKAGANVNLAEHKTGRSPLHLAMEKHPTLVGPLLCHPLIDTDSTDFRGYTAFRGYTTNEAANCAVGANVGIHAELLLIAEKSSKNERQAIFSYLRKENAKLQKLSEDIDENVSSESSADTDSEDDPDGFTAGSNHQDKIENTPFQNTNCTREHFKTFDEEKLCKILDANGDWKKLGKFIGFDETILKNLEKLSQDASPARIILTKVKSLYDDDEETLKNVLQRAELEETSHMLEGLKI